MFQKSGFADACSEIEEADFVVLGLPFDSTTSFRSGSRDGPDAIRLASYNFESYDCYYDVDLSDLRICDLGNMELGSDPLYARESIREGLSAVGDDQLLIALGGEHSITPPLVEHQAKSGPLSVLVLDAHLDLRDEYGFTRFSHACTSRRILEVPHLCGYSSIGIRSGSREEFAYAREMDLSYFTAEVVRNKGIDYVLDLVSEELKCERIYLSLDMDFLDPTYAPAVGNPEPFGMTPWVYRRILERLGKRIVALDITEVAPAYDRGETALMAAKLAREFIAVHSK